MKINIAVSSNNKFVQKTYPIVIRSLIDGGIDSKDIYIFNGHDLDDNKQNILNNYYGVNFFNLDYSCFEINSMIGILDEKLDICDYWFLMHDTCKVGPAFKKFIYDFSYNNANSVRPYKNGASGSIGAYKYSWLKANEEKILFFKNNYQNFTVQKMKEETVKKEDFLTNQNNYYDSNPPKTKIVEFFGGTRLGEYYRNLDFYKYKANYRGCTTNNFIVNDIMK